MSAYDSRSVQGKKNISGHYLNSGDVHEVSCLFLLSHANSVYLCSMLTIFIVAIMTESLVFSPSRIIKKYGAVY